MTTAAIPSSPAAAPASPLRAPQPGTQEAKMRNAAQQFESYFVYQFLELMTPKPEDGGVFSGSASLSGSFGEQMFRHELNQQMASNIVRQGGFGLTDAVYRAMLHQQEAAQ